MCTSLLVLAGAAPLTLITTSCLSRSHTWQNEIYCGRVVVRHGRTSKVEMKEGKSCLTFFFKLKRLRGEMTGSVHFVLHVVFKFYLFIATLSCSCSNQRPWFVPPPRDWPPLKAEQRVFLLHFFCCFFFFFYRYDFILEFLLTSAITLEY